MMVLCRDTGALSHGHAADLPAHLRPGDVLVLNDTRVIPARVFGVRNDTGGRVEVLFLEEAAPGEWEVYYRASGPARAGQGISLAAGAIAGEIARVEPGGRVRLKVRSERPLPEILDEQGHPPLPPYIKRPRGGAPAAADRDRYQTVYARQPGAVAAPTAGLHLTAEMLRRIEAQGVRIATLTLHVGPGTFRPVKVEDPSEHAMESERYAIPPETAAAVRTARAKGGRVVAVGTTTVRALESVFSEAGAVVAREGRTALFIREPCRFGVVDALLTNFHLPRSTLLMLVCAFAGRDRVMNAYREAVAARYRFYSYGDCMLIV
jgi:S-adenosylmethionine:tRNA ribosyltransferase-isomerase